MVRMSANFRTGQNGQSIGSTLTWTSLDISPRTSCRYTMYAMNSNHAPISSGGTSWDEQQETEHIDRMAIIKSFLMCKVFFGCYPNISRWQFCHPQKNNNQVFSCYTKVALLASKTFQNDNKNFLAAITLPQEGIDMGPSELPSDACSSNRTPANTLAVDDSICIKR